MYCVGLQRELGGITLFELLARMTNEELNYQFAYDSIMAERQQQGELDSRNQRDLQKQLKG